MMRRCNVGDSQGDCDITCEDRLNRKKDIWNMTL